MYCSNKIKSCVFLAPKMAKISFFPGQRKKLFVFKTLSSVLYLKKNQRRHYPRALITGFKNFFKNQKRHKISSMSICHGKVLLKVVFGQIILDFGGKGIKVLFVHCFQIFVMTLMRGSSWLNCRPFRPTAPFGTRKCYHRLQPTTQWAQNSK